MDLAERIQSLRGLDLFAGFTDQEVADLAQDVEEIHLPAEAVLFDEGEIGTDMFVLLTGSLRISKEKQTIAEIRPVDYVGEMALIDRQPRSACIRTVTASTLLRVASQQFERYLAQQPHALVVLMRSLSHRVRRDTETLVNEFEQANILIHDMRNLLVPFLYLSSLGKEIVSESGRSKLASLFRARDGLSKMMEEALANAKRLRYRPVVQTTSLARLVEELVALELAVHPDLADKKMNVSVAPGLPDFVFNDLEIRRVVANLVINAGQASRPGDTIEVAVLHQGDHARVDVIDHGGGVPEELRERIFQAHFTTRPDGNGLGLASCREIIEKRHGGSLSVQSVPDVKTIFSFTLPYRYGDGSLA